MKKELPPVDVIIVNYNGIQYIDACLGSLLKTDYPNFSVIIFDNGSTDGSLELVREKYPEVTVIANKENLGFGKANTIGMRAGNAEFITLLNSDTVVEKNWLRSLVEAIRDDDKTAAVCSKLLFLKHPSIINAVGGGMNYIGYGYDIGMYEVDNRAFNEKRNVFFPSGAACLLRRSAFQDVGGFDEKYFMYHEDVDLGWRFWLKGYRVRCIPESVVYHAFGGTSLRDRGMEFRNYLGLRHALRSMLKNYELPTLMRTLPVFITLGLRTTIKGRSMIFIKSILWNLRFFHNTMKERIHIQKTRKVRDSGLRGLIWQAIRLPVQYPDYNMMNLETFSSGGNRRSFFDMSCNAWENLGYGWHALEVYFVDGKTKYRWSKDEVVIYLWNKYGKGIISMDILALSKTLDRERKISVSVNGNLSHEFAIESDNWETIEIPYKGIKGALEIKIKVDDTWTPDDLFKNGDDRRLGVGLKRAEFKPEGPTIQPATGISVIIPTYNRSKTLLRTLKALEDQSLSKETFEVVIVDDGSTDITEKEVNAYMAQSPINIKYLRQENKKQGAARNLGIKYAEMPLIVFIGDDIIPSPTFLEEHLNHHREYNKYGNIAVLGYTKWSEEIKVTPFMRFIGEYGYQFGYALIENDKTVPFNFFYTSNISILKAFLDELEYVFEEDFDTYGWEDIELGYRLDSIGMKLLYNQNAVAYHHHSMDIPSFCRRQVNVGKASRIFLRKHPELDWFLGNPGALKKLKAFSFLLPAIEKIINFVDKTFLFSFPRIFYDIVLKANYAKGALASEG